MNHLILLLANLLPFLHLFIFHLLVYHCTCLNSMAMFEPWGFYIIWIIRLIYSVPVRIINTIFRDFPVEINYIGVNLNFLFFLFLIFLSFSLNCPFFGWWDFFKCLRERLAISFLFAFGRRFFQWWTGVLRDHFIFLFWIWLKQLVPEFIFNCYIMFLFLEQCCFVLIGLWKEYIIMSPRLHSILI